MHEKVLPDQSLDLLRELEADPSPLLATWTLAGGTGLALQLGHRISVDLNLFRDDLPDTAGLHAGLRRHGTYETLQDSSHTLSVIIRGTRLSFYRSPAPFIFPGSPYGALTVADIRDIALMKLIAITNRGSRKDFIDLYTILRDGPTLEDYFDLLPRKYDPSALNTYSILKSLTWFEDADREPMPRMLVPFRWEECRAFLERAVHSIVLR